MSIIEIIQSVLEREGSAFFYTPPIYDDAVSYIFGVPEKKVSVQEYEKITDHLELIDKLKSEYDIGYGYIAYEAGYELEEDLNDLRENSKKDLLNFCFYKRDNYRVIPSSSIEHGGIEELLSNQKFECSNLSFNTDKEEYIKNISLIKEQIKEGYTYQVNYTLRSRFNFSGDVAAFILNLIFNQSAKYIAVINHGGKIIISSSPELFFETSGEQIICRPMKGTITRGRNIDEDKKYRNELAASAKDKAENIMIVDLLRNDVGKIADIDTVSASNKYHIEKYESVFQMTSEIRGQLTRKDFKNIITGIFPNGSVTGAPKISTMKIIKDIEKEERNIYTGAIGIIQKDRLIFNVPIRTIEIDRKNNEGILGLGSGVVWESDPYKEYDEVLLKGKYLTNPANYFELFESMLIENKKIFLLQYHLERLKESADFFLFLYEEKRILEYLNTITEKCDVDKSYKLRISLSKWGGLKYSLEEVTETQTDIDICLSGKTVNSMDRYLYFKTTNRNLYDEEYSKNSSEGFAETIFMNEHEHLTEGCRTNLLIRKNEMLYTPPISDGLLNGCYRKYLIESGSCEDGKSLTLKHLIEADECLLVNSVRKEINVKRIFKNGNLLKEY